MSPGQSLLDNTSPQLMTTAFKLQTCHYLQEIVNNVTKEKVRRMRGVWSSW